MHIAIVGGGIGGLVAAIAVRAAGHWPIVLERSRSAHGVGGGISITPNAVKGLESLGLGEALSAIASEPLDQHVLDGESGDPLLHFDRRQCRERYGAPYYQMHRADLHGLLLRTLDADHYRRGQSVVGLGQHEDGVTLDLADGGVVRADLVIGADGLRSTMRDLLFQTPPPRFSGHVAWRALVPADLLPPEASAPANRNHVGPGRNLVTYPVCGGTLVNVVALTRAGREAAERWNLRANPTMLAAQFAGWAPYVRQVLAALRHAPLFRWGLFVREPLAAWACGRAALLGDAAHPMLPYMGQGASSAIEDAVVLGRCLAGITDGAAAALRRYQASRIDRASFLQAESNLGGDRLQALNPVTLKTTAPAHEDALGIFAYDPATAPLA